MSDQTGWEGRAQQLGTRIATVWTLSQALGQAKENKYALEFLDGYIVCSCWELKRKFRLSRRLFVRLNKEGSCVGQGRD